MEKMSINETRKVSAGKDIAGCGLYVLEAGLVAMVGGMAFGPLGFGMVLGFLATVPNPC